METAPRETPLRLVSAHQGSPTEKPAPAPARSGLHRGGDFPWMPIGERIGLHPLKMGRRTCRLPESDGITKKQTFP